VAVTPIPSPDGLATQKDICIKSNASLHLAILKPSVLIVITWSADNCWIQYTGKNIILYPELSFLLR
jgi:hypothetical protein